jgi:hypothetical protein
MKVYEYKGKHYSEEDMSLEDDYYDGDLYDLYLELKQDGECSEDTVYYVQPYAEATYLSPEELIKSEFSVLVIEEKESEDER